MRAIIKSAAVSIVLLVGGSAFASGHSGSFPRSSEWIASPDARYAIGNLNRDTPDQNGNSHELQLKNLSSGVVTGILSYGRHVDVMWSPKGSRLAVTNHSGSDISDCLIFDPKSAQSPIGLTSLLEQQIADFGTLMKDSHLYIECGHWSGESSLTVVARGWNDDTKAKINQRYKFDLSKNLVTELNKK